MKMISLLLLILSSCLCAATFVVNVTQSSYEAEENHSITLEWTFTTRTQGSWKNLFIYCEANTDHGGLVLYQVHEGVEIPGSQDDQFSGRVQSDKDVLREGRIRLHVSRLRTEDSGLYLCDVMTDYGFNSGRCRLNVTASSAVFNHLKKDSTSDRKDSTSDRKDSTSDRKDSASDSRGRIGLYVLLGLTAATFTVLLIKHGSRTPLVNRLMMNFNSTV